MSDAWFPEDSLTSDFTMVELVIPAPAGRIRWNQVAATLATALKLDQASIEEKLPDGEFDLSSPAVSLSLLAINLTFGDRLSFSIAEEENGRTGLLVRCNADLLPTGSGLATDGMIKIHHDADWLRLDPARPLILCLHGLNGTYDSFDGLRQNLRSPGEATAAVEYDCQRAIAVIAQGLSEVVGASLDSLPSRHALVLVGHSMGGLIGREWTNNPALNNQSIKGLITLGSPHRGSAWATLPPLMQLFANGEFEFAQVSDLILHSPSSPALRDIAPGSAFLNALNARTPRLDVRYTSVVGVGSPFDAATVGKIQQTFRDLQHRDGFVRLIRPRIEPLLGGFDELVRGRGDGMVAAQSAAMCGTEDLVEVDLSHFALVRMPGDQRTTKKVSHPVWEVVLERVESCHQRLRLHESDVDR